MIWVMNDVGGEPANFFASVHSKTESGMPTSNGLFNGLRIWNHGYQLLLEIMER